MGLLWTTPGVFYRPIWAAIGTGSTQDTLAIFHRTGLNHITDSQAHRADSINCMAILAFIGFRIQMK